jgi:hypothetical protein
MFNFFVEHSLRFENYLTHQLLLTQRNFEDRLGHRIDKLDASQKSRSEKLDTTLQHMQTDINYIASRLLNIAASMQNLEEKLNWIGESGTGDKRQQRPQKRNNTSPANLQSGASLSMGSRHSEGSDAGLSLQIKSSTQVESAEQVGIGKDSVVRKRSSQDTVSVGNMKRVGPDRAQSHEENGNLESPHEADGVRSESHPEETDLLPEEETQFEIIDKKLERISASLGIKNGTNEGDDEEDRRRLKEKLKVAIEVDRRSRVLAIVSRSEVWIEYIFGICSPDQRIGKSGSRWNLSSAELRPWIYSDLF